MINSSERLCFSGDFYRLSFFNFKRSKVTSIRLLRSPDYTVNSRLFMVKVDISQRKKNIKLNNLVIRTCLSLK